MMRAPMTPPKKKSPDSKRARPAIKVAAHEESSLMLSLADIQRLHAARMSKKKFHEELGAAGAKFPAAKQGDPPDTSWALKTAAAMWDRYEYGDALKWLHRASESAREAQNARRCQELLEAYQEASRILDEQGPPPVTPQFRPPMVTPVMGFTPLEAPVRDAPRGPRDTAKMKAAPPARNRTGTLDADNWPTAIVPGSEALPRSNKKGQGGAFDGARAARVQLWRSKGGVSVALDEGRSRDGAVAALLIPLDGSVNVHAWIKGSE